MVETRIYKKTDIENLINIYELSYREFEICGKFLGEYYIIAEEEYSETSPYHQLKNYIEKKNYNCEHELGALDYNYLTTEVSQEDFKDIDELIEDINDEVKDLERQMEVLKKRRNNQVLKRDVKYNLFFYNAFNFYN